MPTDSYPSEEHAAPYLRPFLDALDGMHEHEVRSPDELKQRAADLLIARCGASSASIAVVFAQGAVSLLSDHTHYSDGFAVLMPVQQGTAIAIRCVEGEASRIVFEGGSEIWSFDSAVQRPRWVDLIARVVAEFGPPEDVVEMAVVSTLPAVCTDAYLAALAVATARALLVCGEAAGTYEADEALEARLPALRRILAACTEMPFSIALPIASYAGGTDAFTLIDTATYEHLPVETTARSELGWSLLDPGARPRDAEFHRLRRNQAEEAITYLQAEAFEGLTSFRELEHQDLPRAIEVLPPPLVPIVRHLVSENRRVQKLVAAMRRNDWQMIGALLLMSHASRRDAWKGTSEQADFLVAHTETMTLESIYGACMTGRGGYVVLVARPHAMLLCLDDLSRAFAQRFEERPNAMPL